MVAVPADVTGVRISERFLNVREREEECEETYVELVT